jgi:hypothetical protein
VFVGYSRIFLLGILIFKGLTARRLYKAFGVNGLTNKQENNEPLNKHVFIQNRKHCPAMGMYIIIIILLLLNNIS